MTPGGRFQKRPVWRYTRHQPPRSLQDAVIAEEPFEIRLITGPLGQPEEHPFLLTMRTPGDDYALAVGLLFSEGLIQEAADIVKMVYCVGADKTRQHYNILKVRLRPGLQLDLSTQQRWGVSYSSCGLCGKTQLEQLDRHFSPVFKALQLSVEVLYALPERLWAAQKLFEKTGGVHAAGLFDLEGHLLAMAEDVGRHNALDKLIGHCLLQGGSRLSQSLLLLSGRPSFEMIQKALRANISIVAAVGAPSSLAIALAQRYGQTLIGFLKAESLNVYSGRERLC